MCGWRRARDRAVCDGLSESAGSCDAIIDVGIAFDIDGQLGTGGPFGKNESSAEEPGIGIDFGVEGRGTLSAAREVLFEVAVPECGTGAEDIECSCSVALE